MLSPRLSAIVRGLPVRPDSRVLEIGCGPGAAAIAVAGIATAGFVLGIDRSARAVEQLRRSGAALITAGRLEGRVVAVEDFAPEPGEELYDLAFANRVGALDGRHRELEDRALDAVRGALTAAGALYVDGVERPLR